MKPVTQQSPEVYALIIFCESLAKPKKLMRDKLELLLNAGERNDLLVREKNSTECFVTLQVFSVDLGASDSLLIDLGEVIEKFVSEKITIGPDLSTFGNGIVHFKVVNAGWLHVLKHQIDACLKDRSNCRIINTGLFWPHITVGQLRAPEKWAMSNVTIPRDVIPAGRKFDLDRQVCLVRLHDLNSVVAFSPFRETPT